MRIAVLNWSNQVLGGTEEYLRTFLPAATRAGHTVSFWTEVDSTTDQRTIPIPDGGGGIIGRLGLPAVAAQIQTWRPDLIYAHGSESPAIEERLYPLAPTVFFAHAYYGTCISGTKTTLLPVVAPCERVLGPGCLVNYFPRRCGGLNPLTMWSQYRLQGRRLHVLRSCAALVTHSEHMRAEYLRHGFPAEQVHALPYYIHDTAPPVPEPRPLPDRPTLLYLGRMEATKGGLLFLDALPRVRTQLQKPLRVLFAGDGRSRAEWESKALSLQRQDPHLTIEFRGWLNEANRSTLLRETDVLVVPSVWPEPFGRVGPEAGQSGVPVVAFAHGGTSDWLTDDENGYLVQTMPPSGEGLAMAISRCLRDEATYNRLRIGAARLAARFTWDAHFQALLTVFQQVLARTGPPNPAILRNLS